MNRREFLKNSGWTLLGAAAGASFIGCATGAVSSKADSRIRRRFAPEGKKQNIYWGDVHNHCNITYGHGGLEAAFEAAKEQLDFVSVTPHALWPDIPGKGDPRLEWVIEYHESAFRRLRAGGWDRYVESTGRHNDPGKFLTFLSYECHSMEHGDHVVLHHDLRAPLLECASVPDLMRQLEGQKAFITPHHLGYMSGYRGYNWAAFKGGDQTPFVEIFSRHGLAESDQGDYDYLHDMGPRTWEGSALYGLEQGNRFGIMGSTDQHAGYPGSYGDGRMAVLAPSLDRDALWEAIRTRRIYCATGDKIAIDLRVNGEQMGGVTRGHKRDIYLGVEGWNFLDYVEIVKNGRTFARFEGPQSLRPMQNDDPVRARVKLEFGWNREEEPVRWDGEVRIDGGVINGVETCFRGLPYTSPQPGVPERQTKVNRLTKVSADSVAIEMYSVKNPNTLTPAMQGVILDVTMPRNAKITAAFNGRTFSHTLGELLEGSHSHFMRGWLSEAIRFNRAATPEAWSLEAALSDGKPERDADYYYARVRQRDGQWAWSSPIWVERV
ncbi:Tat pathway signal sequence [Bacteroidia bacterium]|nr:Tat pathway signal sequence [Bacteroidia bacterium]